MFHQPPGLATGAALTNFDALFGRIKQAPERRTSRDLFFRCAEDRPFSPQRHPLFTMRWQSRRAAPHNCWTRQSLRQLRSQQPELTGEQKVEIAYYQQFGKRSKPPRSPRAWSNTASPLTPSSFFPSHEINGLERELPTKQVILRKKLAHTASYEGGNEIPADFWVRPRAISRAKQAHAAALFCHRPVSKTPVPQGIITILAADAETPFRHFNQCAAALQVGLRTIRKMISSGEMLGTQAGDPMLVKHQDLLACIKAIEKARPTPPWPDFSAVEQHADREFDNQSDSHSAFDEIVAVRTGHIPALADDATHNRAKASAMLFDLAETAGYSSHKVGAYSRVCALSDDPAEGVSRHVSESAAKWLKAAGYSDAAAWLRAHEPRIRKPLSPGSRGDIEAHIEVARDALKSRPAAFEVWLADFQSKALHVQQRQAYDAGRYRKALAALKADPTAFKAWCNALERLKPPPNIRTALNDDALIVGFDAIAQALGRSKLSVIRSVTNGCLPVAELHGQPVLLKALVPHLRDRAKTDCSRAKSKSRAPIPHFFTQQTVAPPTRSGRRTNDEH